MDLIQKKNYVAVALLIWVFGVIFFIIYFYYATQYWKRKGVPYISALELLTFVIKVKNCGLIQIFQKIYRDLKRENQKVGGWYVCHIPNILIISPDILKLVLVKDFGYFHNRCFSLNTKRDPILFNTFTKHAEDWRSNRSKLIPTFSSGNIKMMFQQFNSSSKILNDVLKKYSDGCKPFNAEDLFTKYTTDNIVSCAFGIQSKCLVDENDGFYKHGNWFRDDFLGKPYLTLFGIYISDLINFLRIRYVDKKLAKFYFDVIKQTVEYREQNDVHRKDFLDIYIKMKNNQFDEDDDKDMRKYGGDFTMNEVFGSAFMFVVAGQDTTKSTLTFGYFELALNQDIQEKLRREIVANVKKFDEQVTYDGIMEMNYLDKVVCEVLRKWPVIPLFNRRCTKDYKIPGTNMVIGKGVAVWIPVLAIHRDSRYYPDPEKFDPERFSAEEKIKRNPFVYLPFGSGPRACIGKRFAIIQVKATLANTLLKYKFTLDPGTKLPIVYDHKYLFLASKNKILLQCHKL